MVVDDGQRVADRAVDELHPTLEVHLPELVRCRLFKPAHRARAANRRDDPFMAAQDRMDRRGRRRFDPLAPQHPGDLAGAPGRMGVPNRQHPRLDRPFAAPGTDRGPVRSVGQSLIARLPSRQPSIARVRADPEPPTQLPPVRPFLKSKPNKLPALLQNRRLPPRHRATPRSPAQTVKRQASLRTPVRP
jgi:hypothetical protein